ncbi:MAG: O-antigen ligase family protein [Acidimicrobiia bacterium]|nr:O-antigen ligase family protein [Acidimicrobiia bacterium]
MTTMAVMALPAAWALGLAEFMWPVLALPMAFFLLSRERVRMPRSFLIWLAYLAIAVVAVVSAGDGARILTVYLAASIVFLFAFNATSDELPDSAIVALIGLYWVVVAVGGVLALIFGTTEFPSLANTLFVDESNAGTFWDDVTRVQLSDGLKVGEQSGLVVDHRPKGFLAYANHFGAALVMFLPALALLRAQLLKGRWARALDIAAVVAVIPFVISRNRWAWLSLVVVAVYLIARLWRPHPKAARVMLTGLSLMLLLVAVTPLQGIVTDRLQSESSKQYRSDQYSLSWELIQMSPWLGFGGNQTGDDPLLSSPSEFEDLNLGADSQILQTTVNHGIPALIVYAVWLFAIVIAARSIDTPVLAVTHLAGLVAILHTPFYVLTPHRWVLLMLLAGASFRHLHAQGRVGTVTLWSKTGSLEARARRGRRRDFRRNRS